MNNVEKINGKVRGGERKGDKRKRTKKKINKRKRIRNYIYSKVIYISNITFI